ncbi:MAG: hypothetical protein QOK11_1521, partial [Pseudonocardiales bacterium]|nr:hypothetical protein [Pseudonocardiales bacterium]
MTEPHDRAPARTDGIGTARAQ